MRLNIILLLRLIFCRNSARMFSSLFLQTISPLPSTVLFIIPRLLETLLFLTFYPLLVSKTTYHALLAFASITKRWFIIKKHKGTMFFYFLFFLFLVFFGGLECVGHSFAYVAHLWFLRDVWIRTQSAAVASWRATDLATHPSRISHPSLFLLFHALQEVDLGSNFLGVWVEISPK